MRLYENQAGFRKEYLTLDHIFSLNAIIEILKHRKKKLFCCFVDFFFHPLLTQYGGSAYGKRLSIQI